jgi:hypothetical protein
MAGQLKVNGVTLATEESGTVTLEAPQIKDSSNNVILDQSGTNPVLKNVEVVNNSSMMFRNRIINGDMRIDQRNSGGSVSVTDSNPYTLDRWKSYSSTSSSKYTIQQSSIAPAGFSNSLLVTSSSTYSVQASDYYLLNHTVEGFNWADMDWGNSNAKTVTLSFWVQSSLTGTFGGVFKTYSGPSLHYPFTYEILQSNTWEQKTITVAGPTSTWASSTTNGGGVELNFSMGTGSTFSGPAGSWSSTTYFSATGATSVVGTSGATWYITGVQLEEGTVATQFEHRPIGTELALCQRYYTEASPNFAFAYNSTQVTSQCVFNEMRANPSASKKSGDGNIDPISGANISPSSVSDNFYVYDNKSVLINSYNFSGLTLNKVYWYGPSSLIVSLSAEL